MPCSKLTWKTWFQPLVITFVVSEGGNERSLCFLEQWELRFTTLQIESSSITPCLSFCLEIIMAKPNHGTIQKTPQTTGDFDGSNSQWIGLRENLQETIDFPMKYRGFPVNVPLNQSIEIGFRGFFYRSNRHFIATNHQSCLGILVAALGLNASWPQQPRAPRVLRLLGMPTKNRKNGWLT